MLTQVPPGLREGQVTLKRKVCDTEDDLSGQETESDSETIEGDGNESQPHVINARLSGCCLTAASHFTNQSCINVLVRPAKKVKAGPTLNQNVVSYSTQTPSSRSTPTSSTPTPSSCSVPSTSTLTLFARSNRLTKAQRALTQIPATPSEAPPSVTTTGSAGQVRSMKADLPPELVADGRWQRVLIPTLLLWAGGKDDVWRINSAARDKFKTMAEILLEDCSFLYDNLDASSPRKAFQSNLVRQLLSSVHLHYVDGAMLRVHSLCPSLYNYCGVIGLCGAVLEHALCMVIKGYITWEMIEVMPDGKNAPKTPVKLNKHSGKESHFALVFSDQNWGKSTRLLTKRVEKHTASQVMAIVKEARRTPLTFLQCGASSSASASTIVIDPYAHIFSIPNTHCQLLRSPSPHNATFALGQFAPLAFDTSF
ncbi:hypothetical protein V8E55_008105 [Tylopilus felleus]